MNAQALMETRQVFLRPARQDEETFLFQVYASTRAAELAGLDWTPEQKAAFLQMQSTAQLRHYRLYYPQAQYQIIEQNGVAVGRLIVDESKNPILLLDIALLPASQGHGVGTALIQKLIAEAAQRNWALCLHVETFNPAMRLYHRLGFVKSDEMGLYHELRWQPPASPGEEPGKVDPGEADAQTHGLCEAGQQRIPRPSSGPPAFDFEADPGGSARPNSAI